MKVFIEPNSSDWSSIIERPTMATEELLPKVAAVINEVKRNGDAALKAFTLEFDKVALESIEVSSEEIEKASALISKELKTAIEVAKNNIQAFHATQVQGAERIETMSGVWCWRKSVGIEKVGLYIPGGTAPLFSTVLMLGIPAVLAGCKEIVLCTPPNKEGEIHSAILYAASLVGVTKIYKLGGVQAIAAMALGTESVPKVFKIFGPGNQYVTAAKQMIQQMGVAIDMPAGPSEVCVWADDTCNADFVAADLLSQAEHGIDSQVLLVVSNEAILHKVQNALENQLALLPREAFAAKALENSKAVVLSNREVAMQLINNYAPEHLILSVENTDQLIDKIINSGSVFIGNFSPESAGDYASGTNHTLPTNGYAKAYSGVSVDSFVKKITFQHLTERGIEQLGTSVIEMAKAEGLEAHANAVKVRLAYINSNK
jgi:histidinol dehydrogenase